MIVLLLLFAVASIRAEEVRLPGLREPVEILRDRWGVPHIYARNQDDLFFAQGYIAARDRLWQIDVWRRAGAGRLSEAFGDRFLERDRMALLVRFRGDWKREWTSYAPDTWQIANAFVNGVNAFIRSPDFRLTADFRTAGYEPGLWTPNDVVNRLPGLAMVHNAVKEVNRATDIQRYGLAAVQRYLRPDPPVAITIPNGLELADVSLAVLGGYNSLIRLADLDGGSNNWVVDGKLSASGKPLLASDPHRRLQIPSLRKTVHLVAPGWNAIGAGEPALPGIALGHNEHIAFGFTIAGVDQQDLYVETLHPSDASRYRYKGQWRAMEIERHSIPVKGGSSRAVELEYTVHGPVIHVDKVKRRAYALRWVGTEPGTAGYLGSLSVARARNWAEFSAAVERFRTPAENMTYADTEGNIGWIVGALTPVRGNWNGLLPVPGEKGEYEWRGFLPPTQLPRVLNPPRHFWATANHNILPDGYPHTLQYEWAAPWRAERINELLSQERRWRVTDFERMQQDVVSLPARRLQGVLRKWSPRPANDALSMFLAWDCALKQDSIAAAIYEVWIGRIAAAIVEPPELGARLDLRRVLEILEASPDWKVLEGTLTATVEELGGAAPSWGRLHQLTLRHPLGRREFQRGPFARPGDANTVNAASGSGGRVTSGASYRQIFDLADWDRGVMTNLPGESGDPENPHYSDLAADWAGGKYHPLPFTRRAVEQAASGRIVLAPLR